MCAHLQRYIYIYILPQIFLKTVQDRNKCQKKLDRKSCMDFRMVGIFLTLDDFQRSKAKVKPQKL